MIFLGACCGEQQGTKNSKCITNNLLPYTIKRKAFSALNPKAFSALVIALIFLLFTVFGTVAAQQTNVRLELLTNSNRLASGVNSSSIAIGSESPIAIGSQVSLRVSSDSNNYIYIFNYDAVGALSQLTDSTNNFIRAGNVHNYPSVNSHYTVQGPAGRENIFAIASFTPLSEQRLQQLVNQQIQQIHQTQQVHQAQSTASRVNTRALISGNTSNNTNTLLQQDGWLADTIMFNVIDAYTTPVPVSQVPATQVPVSQVPVTPVPVSQAPGTPIIQKPVNSYSPSQQPVSVQQPIDKPSFFNPNKICSLSGLQLSAPNDSIGFSQRCINKSFDSSFENPANMEKIVVHFGTELVKQGFSYQATTKSHERDFRATFNYQGKIYQMQVEKSGQYYRFELLEFNQTAIFR